jgi:multicomponent Na+:H+ antiporter subunit E
MTRTVLTLAILTAVYLLTLASAHPLDVAFGVVLATALLWTVRGFLFVGPAPAAGEYLRRFLAAPRFALQVVWDITVGTWTVSLMVLGLKSMDSPGIVDIPIGERTDTGVAVTSLATTLSPGEVLVDVDWDNGVMLMHVLDASDPAAVRAQHHERYMRHQRKVFP